MHDGNFETQKDHTDTRTPEEIAQDNLDRHAVLGDMYSPDRFVSDGRTDLDAHEVFDVMDNKSRAQDVGVSEARSEIADVYSQIASGGSPESAALYSQEAAISAQVEEITGEDADRSAVAKRVGAEVLNNVGDGTAGKDNRAQLGSLDTTKVVRATVAAELLKKLESDPTTLDNFTRTTTSRVRNFVQTARNRGGIDKTSNADLEEAGRYVEQEPEVQEALEAKEQKPAFDAEALAIAWVRGDEATVARGATQLPETLKATIDALIAARRTELVSHEVEIVHDIAEMIAEATEGE